MINKFLYNILVAEPDAQFKTGFSGLGNLPACLLPGQRVYMTHLGREMEATVMQHNLETDQVVVNLAVSLLDLTYLASECSLQL